MPWMMGFQTTDEDVQNAAASLGHDVSLEEAERLLAGLDQTAIARAALEHANDLDGQASAARDEIVRQLGVMGITARSPGP